MTHAFAWMAFEALIAALVAGVLVRMVMVRVKLSARTFTLRDARGREVARFILDEDDDFVSAMEREVSRLEFEMPYGPTAL